MSIFPTFFNLADTVEQFLLLDWWEERTSANGTWKKVKLYVFCLSQLSKEEPHERFFIALHFLDWKQVPHSSSIFLSFPLTFDTYPLIPMSPQRNLGEIDIKMTSQNEKQSTVDDMSSVTASIVSNDHFSTSRASMSLASVQGSHSANNDGDDIMETSTVGSSNTTQSLRKRKLERVEEAILAAASSTRDPKDRWKESTGLTMLSFPLKLHRVLHDYEMSCEENELKNSFKSTEENKKAKTE